MMHHHYYDIVITVVVSHSTFFCVRIKIEYRECVINHLLRGSGSRVLIATGFDHGKYNF